MQMILISLLIQNDTKDLTGITIYGSMLLPFAIGQIYPANWVTYFYNLLIDYRAFTLLLYLQLFVLKTTEDEQNGSYQDQFYTI